MLQDVIHDYDVETSVADVRDPLAKVKPLHFDEPVAIAIRSHIAGDVVVPEKGMKVADQMGFRGAVKRAPARSYDVHPAHYQPLVAMAFE